MKTHLVSDVPVATFCSGGVDSSLVTAFSKKYNPNIIAYVANCEDAFQEGERARQVGQHLGVEVRQVNYTVKEYLQDWPISVWYNDQPPCYRSDQAFMKISKQCQEDGIKVVLTGEGADELFGGYEWQWAAYYMYKTWKWCKLAH